MKFCVIGLGRFGYQLAVSLAKDGNQVLAVDKNQSLVDSVSEHVTQAICCEVLDAASLEEVGIEDLDTAIVAIGESFSQSILITALLKKSLNVQTVIARAINPIHETILQLVGADKVISLERDMAIKLAQKLNMPFGEIVYLTQDFVVAQVNSTKAMVGNTIKELISQKKIPSSCFAVKKESDIFTVSGEYRVVNGDVLIIAGNIDDIESALKS